MLQKNRFKDIDTPDWFSDPRGLGRPLTKKEMIWAVANEYVIPQFRTEDISVELLLDYVDLKLEWYVPSVEAFEFVNFIRLCIGKEPENLNSITQYFYLDVLFGSKCVDPYFQVRGIVIDDLNRGNPLLLSTREFSKSVLTIYFMLFLMYRGSKPNSDIRVNYGVYVSDSMKGNVKKTMQTVESLFLSSSFLMEAFEEYHFTDASFTLVRKPTKPEEIKAYNRAMKSHGKKDRVPGRMDRTYTIDGHGASSGGRGARDGLDRPTWVVFDDMIANEVDANSEATLTNIESTIESDIGKSLSGNGHFKIMINTAYHENDPAYRRVPLGEYVPIVFPKAEVPPHSGRFDRDGNMIEPPMTEENFVSVWSDRHSFAKQRRDYVLAERAGSKGMKSLMQEFYIRVTAEDDRLIPESDIVFKDLSYIWNHAKYFNWYITTDLTTSANSGSNYSGQFLMAVDWEMNHYYMQINLDKVEIKEQYEIIRKMCLKVKRHGGAWTETAIEVDGQQILHLIAIESYFDKKKSNLLFLAKQKERQGKEVNWSGIKSKGSGDKLWRLKLYSNKFYDGEVFFDESLKFTAPMQLLLRELKMTTHDAIKSSSDDGLDTLSQAYLVDIDYPQSAPKIDIKIQSPYLFDVYSDNNGYNDIDTSYEDDYF